MAADVRGDGEESLEDLYRRMRPSLLALAGLLLGSNVAAEDVVHDAFVGYQRAGLVVASPAAYLRTAVVNGARSTQRRSARDRARPLAVVNVAYPPEIDETWRVLRKLPYRQRAAIVLRFYVDLPDDEIAAVLGCRPATVRSLVHRGLARVKERLQ